jgi:DNA-binding NarL/FixJ family response regulator
LQSSGDAVTSRRKFSDEQLIQLHGQGLNAKEIAKQLGISEATVLTHAKRLGLKLERESSDEKLSRERMKADSEQSHQDGDGYFLPPPSRGWPM